ncbi:hypothetical protein K474DRAFT_478163 [Panus rudis PR-1116 ss-1]|nr:hypothetical protein K474DRAFT_478163 [Panus rudis PR-1116 ss-1]
MLHNIEAVSTDKKNFDNMFALANAALIRLDDMQDENEHELDLQNIDLSSSRNWMYYFKHRPNIQVLILKNVDGRKSEGLKSIIAALVSKTRKDVMSLYPWSRLPCPHLETVEVQFLRDVDGFTDDDGCYDTACFDLGFLQKLATSPDARVSAVDLVYPVEVKQALHHDDVWLDQLADLVEAGIKVKEYPGQYDEED